MKYWLGDESNRQLPTPVLDHPISVIYFRVKTFPFTVILRSIPQSISSINRYKRRKQGCAQYTDIRCGGLTIILPTHATPHSQPESFAPGFHGKSWKTAKSRSHIIVIGCLMRGV